jgi:hypothetical protein
MANIKTSKEEREKIINEALEEPETPEVIEEETPEEPQTPQEPEEEPEEDKSNLPDTETRYKESTREAQILTLKNRKFLETVEKAKVLPEPTEDDLKREFPEWEDMTDTEKKLARKNYINEQRFSLVEEAAAEGRNITEWAEKIDSFLTTEIHTNKTLSARLEGREDEFRSFALKPTRRGVDLEDLAKSFLFEEAPVKKNKGTLVNTGSGGQPTKPKEDKIGAEEASRLRKTNHKLYMRYVKDGKIKIDL